MQIQFEPPSIEEIDEIFQQYRVESFIAKGGMGAVYLATQTSLDRKVAIKILPDEFGKKEEYTEAFAREAKAMAKVTHGNLVAVYDFGQVKDMLYIVMEFVEGATLFDLANGQVAEPDEAASVITAICNGLATAHEGGLIHRDIKPANILVNENGQPKIVDFGLARLSGDEAEKGETIYGTPGYTAPEVLSDPYNLDQRVDIYSVGAIFYELLTGQLPDLEDYKPPSELEPDVAIFDHIVKKALRSDRNFRYKNAEDIVNDIAEAMQSDDFSTKLENNNPLISADSVKTHKLVSAQARPQQSALANSLGARNVQVAKQSYPLKSGGGNSNVLILVILIVVVIFGFIIMLALSGGGETYSPPPPKKAPTNHAANEAARQARIKQAKEDRRQKQIKAREKQLRDEQKLRKAQEGN